MTHLRRLILAFVLSCGLAPVFAQAPAPVPALPDAERRTSYSLSGSTGPVGVGFQLYGDGTDYQNWIEIYANGVLLPQSGNWSLASPSGSLATLPRPITDAQVTFTAAQTGTVQVVGARRPRRTSQFSENVGVPARNLNQVFTDIIATLREFWDKTNDFTGRGVFAPPGETMPVLPPATSRANQGVCFDSNGYVAPCVSVPSGTFIAGGGISFIGSNPTTIAVNGGSVVSSLNGQIGPLGLLILPQGRVTLTTGVAVPTTDVIGSASHFYVNAFNAGAGGFYVPIFDGVNWVPTLIASQLSQLVSDTTKSPAAVVASKMYDILVWNDVGVIRATRSPAWASDTSRGTGAGTAEADTTTALPTNKFAVTNGPAANRGTIVATVRSNSSALFNDALAFRWVSNVYNPAERKMAVVDPTSTWPQVTGNTYEQAHSAANQLDWVQAFDGQFISSQIITSYQNTSANTNFAVGIDIDTLDPANISPTCGTPLAKTAAVSTLTATIASCANAPGKGRHIAIWKQFSGTTTGSTWNGNNQSGGANSLIAGSVWN